jgi:hypothetical protein
VPWHADAHWIERNGVVTVTVHFAGEPEASTISSFSPFALCDSSFGFGDFLIGDFDYGDELGFPFDFFS